MDHVNSLFNYQLSLESQICLVMCHSCRSAMTLQMKLVDWQTIVIIPRTEEHLLALVSVLMIKNNIKQPGEHQARKRRTDTTVTLYSSKGLN